MYARLTLIGMVAMTTGAATLAHADVLIADPADGAVKTDGAILHQGGWTIRVGEQNAPSAVAGIFAFQLPTALPDGESFASADFRIQLASITGSVSGFNLDLYALDRVADAPAPLASDYFAGELDNQAMLIQDDFIVAATPLRSQQPYVTTDDAADARLLSFLIDGWDGGANAGRYVFLRLSPDIAEMPAGNNAYNVVSSNAGQSQERPTITYTTAPIPEPASLALVAAGGWMALARRRR